MPPMISTAILPGPAGRVLLDDLRLLQRDPLSMLRDNARRYGDIVHYSLGPWKVFLLNHPDAIQHVLQTNNRNYSKDTFQYNMLSSITGKGLLTSDGEFWLHQRRLIQPAFHRRQVLAFSTLMTDAAVRMLGRWDKTFSNDETIDLDAEMMRLALEIVGQALFTVDLSNEANELAGAVLTALDHIIHKARNPIGLPESFPSARNRRYRAALQKMNTSVSQLIQARRKNLSAAQDGDRGDHMDLLTLMLSARDERTGVGMSEQQLRDEILTLIIAGHETVASALTWTWYLLSQHPGFQSRLQDELASSLQGRIPTALDLPNLPFTRMVFEEALRLYPPAWIITRKSLNDDRITCGYDFRIPPGALVVISPYLIHRHSDYWENPDQFDPSRFSEGSTAARPRYVFIPFGGGPRLCIGEYFATVEAQLVLATVSQHYRLELVPGQQVDPEPLVTLRPRHGLRMKLVRKSC
jgi:cytochrome P450